MNPYAILELQPDCTPDEIHSAYRRLAKQYHPDKGGDPEKFRQLKEAYDVLNDPIKRANYDCTQCVEQEQPSYEMEDISNETEVSSINPVFIFIISYVKTICLLFFLSWLGSYLYESFHVEWFNYLPYYYIVYQLVIKPIFN